MAYQIIWEKAAGNLRGALPTVTQGGTYEVITILALYRDGSAVSLTGKPLTATATDEAGNTTEITGTLTGGAGSFTWEFSGGDIGTPGVYTVIVTYNLGDGGLWASDPARFTVLPNPAADAVQNPALVGIGADDAAWVVAAAAGGLLGELAYIDDADSDGAIYARKNGAWEEVDLSGLAALEAALIPVAVANLAATANGSTAINLAWTYTAAAPITGFKLYRKTGIGGTYALIDSPDPTDTSFADSGLSDYTTYYYRLDAYNTYFTTAGNEANATTAAAYDWYVDSVNGDDDNAGDAPPVAFATIAKLETVLLTGQSAGLARGSHWREQLDIPGAGCEIVAYGTGDDPLLDASDDIAAGAWSKTGGQTNVYQASVTVAAGSTNHLVNAWENGTFLTKVASVAACDALAGSMYVSGNYGAITLYIRPAASDNPATNGKTYAVSARRYGLNGFQIDNLTIRGIKTRRNLYNDGSLVVGAGCSLYDCTAEDGGKHCVYHEDDCYLEGVTAHNASDENNNAGTLFIAYDTGATGAGITYVNCTASMPVYKIGSGFYGHGGEFGTVTFNGCHGENTSTAFGSFTADKEVIGCTATNVNIFVAAVRDTLVQDVTYTITSIAGLEAFVECGSAGGYTITLDGVTLSSNIGNGFAIKSANAAWTADIYDCTFNTNVYAIYMTTAGQTLKSNRNTFANRGTGKIYNINGTIAEADYNTYGTGIFAIAGTDYTWAAYRSAFPALDVNSTHP